MKRTLLFMALSINLLINAQSLLTEDSSALSVGNVGTDITGSTTGQGGWFTTIASGTGSNSDFQITDVGGTYGNAIQITGHNGPAVAPGNPSNSRFMYKSVATNWAARDFGNEIAQVEYDFFTGPPTTSANTMRVSLYNADFTRILAGIMVTMSTPTNTITIRGLGWYDPVANGSTGVTGNYSFGLGSTGGPTPVFSEILLQPNTWYRIGFSYNYGTGEMIYKDAGGFITRNSVNGASPLTPVETVYLLGSTGGTDAVPNTASSTGTFDNISVIASQTDTLFLGVESNDVVSNQISVFPNPVTDLINVFNARNYDITKITITDFNGRIVKENKFNNLSNVQVNIADLPAGMYMIDIKSSEGIATRKIIKN